MPKTMSTIYDIAKEAGVSSTTVSRVLNGSSRVNEATRDHILEIITRLEFVPTNSTKKSRQQPAWVRVQQRQNAPITFRLPSSTA